MKKINKYFSKNVTFNSIVHVIAGIGVGALLTHIAFDPHPVRWGAGLIVVAVLGHLYAFKNK